MIFTLTIEQIKDLHGQALLLGMSLGAQTAWRAGIATCAECTNEIKADEGLDRDTNGRLRHILCVRKPPPIEHAMRLVKGTYVCACGGVFLTPAFADQHMHEVGK